MNGVKDNNLKGAKAWFTTTFSYDLKKQSIF
jgi:hypothetical protein